MFCTDNISQLPWAGQACQTSWSVQDSQILQEHKAKPIPDHPFGTEVRRSEQGADLSSCLSWVDPEVHRGSGRGGDDIHLEKRKFKRKWKPE